MKIINGVLESNPGVALVVNLLGGLRATLWFVLMCLFLLSTGIQSCRLSTAQEKNKTAKVDVKNLTAANKSNVQAIESLRIANKAWADAYDYDLLANETAIIGLRKDNEALTAGLKAAIAEREFIYAKYPKARAWGRTGVNARITDSLLDDTKGR